MRAAGVRRVEQVGVAGAQLAAVPREHGLHRGAHGAQVHGQVRARWPRGRPSPSNTAQLKSRRSLMFTEQAVFCSVAPICSAMDMNRLLKTSRSSGERCDEVGRGGRRRRAAPQQQLAAGQHLGAPARLDDGRAGGLADDRRARRGARPRGSAARSCTGRLVPGAGREHRHRARGARARRGRRVGASRVRGAPPRRRRRGRRPAPTASTASASITRPRPGHQEAVAPAVQGRERRGHRPASAPTAPPATRRCPRT